MKKRIVLIANTVWNIANFRDNLIRSLQNANYEVVVFAPKDGHEHRLNARFLHIPVNAKTTNPIFDILLIFRLIIMLNKIKPDIILNFTIKPVFFGTISAGILRIPCVNNITGLGVLFLRGAALRFLGFVLYFVVMRMTSIVFFQNPDDFQLFSRLGLLRRTKVDILPGSGVDLRRFAQEKKTRKRTDGTVFLFVGRLLAEKGIEEYIDAAQIVKDMYKNAQFHVIGAFNSVGNASALRSKIEQAEREGTILYSGEVEDVRPYIAKADCVVLPSYYPEGTPRCLLEAAAMERPVITTDMPGCRDVVERGKNGYLCRVRDPEDLARKMIQFMGLPAGERMQMGSYGRCKMDRQFDESIVIGKYLSAVRDVLKK